jgi:hypothetical protein
MDRPKSEQDYRLTVLRKSRDWFLMNRKIETLKRLLYFQNVNQWRKQGKGRDERRPRNMED